MSLSLSTLILVRFVDLKKLIQKAKSYDHIPFVDRVDFQFKLYWFYKKNRNVLYLSGQE